MKRISTVLMIGLCAVLMVLLTSLESQAYPTFARKYKTSCSTCHYAFPRLNKFGRAFRNNGYRYPGDDKDYVKEEAVSLGSESYKRVFPNAVWPSDIPGTSVISFHWVSRTHYVPSQNGDEFSFENPHELAAMLPGTMGDHFSFSFELEWESDEFGFGGWLDYMFSQPFHVRIGNIDDLLMPVPDGHRLTREHYNYINNSNIGEALAASGVAIWGAKNGPENKGGFLYSVAAVNGQDNGENADLNSNKDVLVKASYKIGGMGVVGSTESSNESAFWKDNSATFGGFVHTGKNADGTKTSDFGGTTDLFYENLNIFGLYMRSSTKARPVAALESSAAAEPDWINTDIAFAEGDYVVYPWLIPLMRFEYTKPEGVDATKQLIPAVALVVRANVRVTPTARIDLDNSDNNRYDLQVDIGF